jgi:uncharacterized coiled-coil DUF342 family protein
LVRASIRDAEVRIANDHAQIQAKTEQLARARQDGNSDQVERLEHEIEALRNDIQVQDRRIVDWQQQLSEIAERADGLHQSETQLKAVLSPLERELAALQARLKEVERKIADFRKGTR